MEAESSGKDQARCGAIKADGKPCRSRLVRASGYCLRHDPSPEAKAVAAAASLRGGVRSRQRRARLKHSNGIDVHKVGPLNSPEDALKWSEAALVALALGGITATEAGAIRGLLAEWRAGYDATRVAARVDELERRLREVQRAR